MSTDYAEKERAFLDSLKADTGRDLVQWMQLITAQNLAHRNDIIDWLRQQGFMFSKASWLERIHHNSGKPIYADAAAERPVASRRATREAQPPPPVDTKPSAPESIPPAAPSSSPRVVVAPEAVHSAPMTDIAELDDLIAKAKAFRPLAQFVLAEISRAIPAVTFAAETAHVSLRREREFAVLAISPKELRLGLDLGTRPFDDTLKPAKFTNPTARISPFMTHMVLLTDARQVTRELLALVAEAAERKD